MKRSKPQQIKELISQYIKRRGISHSLVVGEIYSAYNSVVGEQLASYTTHRYYDKGTLYCTINSSAARNYLISNQQQFLDKINTMIGSKKVNRLIFK